MASRALTVDPALARTEQAQERTPGALAMDLVQARVHQRLFGGAAREVAIGRFMVMARAGAGGLGVVFEAFDPELGRRVAIKLVSTIPQGSTVSSQARLLAEAQTLARLSHPNIVTVHEVGEWEGRVFIAMEHIDGQTLERWLSTSPSRAQILRAYVQAAQGLAAAHRAGVIHRDFKPANAMIDGTGRVRVLDFGLAIADDGEARTPNQSSSEGATAAESDGATAATHGGTPLYMSPEQRERRPLTARSDQFSFCVSLWSALYGEHPFAGHGEEAMAAAVASGSVRPPPGRGVPAWLRRILLRGLSAVPEQRWPSMDALVDALERGRARARRRVILGSLGAGMTVAAAIAGMRALEQRRHEQACERAGFELRAPWDDDARTAVSDAILATGVGYAATTVDKLVPHLDAYAEALAATGTEACLAGELTHRSTPDLHARAQSCLADRRDALTVLLEELSHADAELVSVAVRTTLALPDVRACADEARLALMPEPPAEQRDDLAALRAEVVRARVVRSTGRTADALAVVEVSALNAQETGWAPLMAEIEVERAALLNARADYAGAERAAHHAYLEAARVGAWDVAARAATRQLEVVGVKLGRHDEGLLWNQLAEIAELHAGERDGELTSTRLLELAGLHYDRSDLAASKAAAEAAIAIDERVLGPDNPRIVRSLTALAEAHLALAEYDRARAVCERVIEVSERALGPDHPTIADALSTLGMIGVQTGDLEGARTATQRGLEIIEGALGSEHPGYASALLNLGVIETQLGERATAREHLERARALLEAVYGREHETRAVALFAIGNTYYQEADYDAALPFFEQTLAIEERVLGPDHPDVAKTLSSIANVYGQRGRSREALPLLERAVAISEASLGRGHPGVAVALRNLAEVLRNQGEHAKALAATERALAVFEAHEGLQIGEPSTWFLHARLLVDTGGDRARALASAREAAEGFEAIHRDQEAAEARAWVAEHEGAEERLSPSAR